MSKEAREQESKSGKREVESERRGENGGQKKVCASAFDEQF